MAVALISSLGGCARYHAAPLSLAPSLQSDLSALQNREPDGQVVPLSGPLTLQNVGTLAVLNDPDLIAARAQRGIAQATLLAAGLPPDPTLTGGFGAFISGPGIMPSISGAMSQDITALITYRVERKAAKAGLAQVDAGILWQEWQVASQAEQLCVTIAGDRQTIASLRANRQILSEIDTQTAQQVASGNLTIAASSTAQAALAMVDTALNTAALTLEQDRNQLDALLGLQPGVDIETSITAPLAIDATVAARAIASLPRRRPDLIALRYGYAQADAKLRAAILMQFLPISVGPAGGRDTSGVFSVGPQVTLTLPLFNRNRPAIAMTTATRAQLAAQFRASFATATGGGAALLRRATLLRQESVVADQQAAIAAHTAAAARHAFAIGALDALAAANLETAAGDREREAVTLRTQYITAEISLATMLGLGLPPMATPDLEPIP
jgi:outer membrane protein TolC